MLTSHVPSFEVDGQKVTKESSIKLCPWICRPNRNLLERGRYISSCNTAKLCQTEKVPEESLSATIRRCPGMNFAT